MVRLIFGRAGSGKTSHIMREIADRAAAGETLLTLIVPEQYSHGAERQLLKIAGDSLSLHGEILSFKRLAVRVDEELGEGHKTLDRGGALLSLHRAMHDMSDRLVLYGGAAQRAQFLGAVLSTVEELRNSAVTSAELLKSAKGKSALSQKLRDLGLILEAFETITQRSGEYDSTSALLRLGETIAESSYASGTLYFDGFNDFTEPEKRIVSALIACGANLTFCLTSPGPDCADDVFRLTSETARDIILKCAELSEKCEITYLDGTGNRPSELLHMERAVFEVNPVEYGTQQDTIRLYCAPDSTAECEYAAAEIKQLVRGGMRYGDIAVMYHGDSSYSRLCESVFEQHGIPVFRSGRDDILEKPPIKLVTSALGIVSSRWRYEDVFSYLKTGLSGLSLESLYRLENYVIRKGIRGNIWMQSEPWYDADDDIEASRRRLASTFESLSGALKSAQTGSEMLRALYAFLEEIDLPNTLYARSEKLRGLGQDRAADEYLQLWDIIVSALDQMYLAVGDMPVELPEFTQLLRLLLSCYDVGVIPVALDRVTLGDMSMTRRRGVRALIVLGATDDNLPSLPTQSGILSDAERDEMVNSLHIPLRDNSERLISREFNTIYSSLTMPSERLTLIYQDGGKRPSFVVQRISKAFKIAPQSMSYEQYALPAELAVTYNARQKLPLNRGLLSPNNAKALYGDVPRLSASRVERFASCKFSFFMQSGLDARERRPELFDAPEAGTFTHYVLEHMANAINSAGGFGAATEQEVRRLTRHFAAEFIAGRYPDFDSRSERFRYLMRRLSSDTERISLDLAHELERSEFEPLGFETRFNAALPDGSFEVTGVIDRIDGWRREGAMYLRVSDYKTGKKAFSLSDVYYGLNMQMLIYLYALERDNLRKNNQQQIIPAAARERDQHSIIPAAALYMPARDALYSAKHNESDEKIAAELSKTLRRNGLLLADREVIDAMEQGEQKLYLPVKPTSEGYSGDSLVTLAQFDRLAEHVKAKLSDTASKLRRGEIDADPYVKNAEDNACKFCKFSGVCGFGTLPDDEYRRIKTLRTVDFWNALDKEAT